MKHLLSLLMVIIILSCQSNNPDIADTENLFKPMIEGEIGYINRNIEGLEADKGKEWYKSDSIFFHLWLKGANEELKGNYQKALSNYKAALNTKRYEISSYEVKLPMGRVLLQLNKKENARKMLVEFKIEAKKDLSGEEVEWGLTDEAKEALRRDLEDCDYMLGMIDAR